MIITEVRIKLMESSEDRLRAFCSITIDDAFVVRDLKIIDGTSGPFVAMPSRKLAGHCQRCSYKNHLRAHYCNQCGAKQTTQEQNDSPQKLYADVAHPINSVCRELIQSAVIKEFQAEVDRSNQPGYRSRYDDEFEYDIDGPGPEQQPIGHQTSSHKDLIKDRTQADESTIAADAPHAVIEPGNKSGPPRPKFIDGPNRGGNETKVSTNPTLPSDEARLDERGFGDGIFD